MAHNKNEVFSVKMKSLSISLSPMSRTIGGVRSHFFKLVDDPTPLLYWYNALGAVVSSKKCHIVMSNVGGKDFLISIWETRCNRPVYHYVLWTDDGNGDGQCRLEKNVKQNLC